MFLESALLLVSESLEEYTMNRFYWETASRAVSVFSAMPVSTMSTVHTPVHGDIPAEFHTFSA